MYIYVFIIFIAIFIIICINYMFLYKNYKNIKNDIAKLYIALKRVRYGDINVRLQSLDNKYLEKTVNRLIETIADRELMIKEYQANLSDKNMSLQEIIRNEKQLRLFKEEFAATLTHDMKVPVIAELNSLNYLLEGRFGELNNKQIEILNLMKSSNMELKELIENMLEIYKLEQKDINLNVAENDINNMLFNIVKEMTPIAVKNSNNIILDLKETENIKLRFDEFQLKRVFKNIIQNALSYSSGSSDILIQSKKEEITVEFRIINKGYGISEEDLKSIFQKYYCGHSKFKKTGTGLGLYLSRQIMLAHNGDINVYCSDDNRTIFTIITSYIS